MCIDMSASLAQTDSIERAPTHRTIGTDAAHAVEITDPQDFNDAVEAAGTLGLSLTDCEIRGTWQAHPSRDCGIGRGFEVEIETAGREWFHLRFEDGETIRAQPRRSDSLEDGCLRMRFD